MKQEQKVLNLLSEIDDLVGQDFDELQDWFSIYGWPVNETRKIGDTINTKVYQSKTEMRFITYLPPGTSFEDHWHDCGETCKVISGELKDGVSGIVWHRDEVAVFSRGQKHLPLNPDNKLPTWLEVKFHK